MSKVRLAEYHYRKALEIHSRSAVLMGCVGMVCYWIASYSEAMTIADSVLYVFHRLSSDVGSVKGLSNYLIGPCGLHLKMHWFAIAGRRYWSLCGNTG